MVIAFADTGVDPIDFPEAPALAIPQALKDAGLSIKDISQFEINEAFSVVVRIAEKVLGIPSDKINVNGCVTVHDLSIALLVFTR
jgi:acetyl-CoA C-acetyltransferase